MHIAFQPQGALVMLIHFTPNAPLTNFKYIKPSQVLLLEKTPHLSYLFITQNDTTADFYVVRRVDYSNPEASERLSTFTVALEKTGYSIRLIAATSDKDAYYVIYRDESRIYNLLVITRDLQHIQTHPLPKSWQVTAAIARSFALYFNVLEADESSIYRCDKKELLTYVKEECDDASLTYTRHIACRYPSGVTQCAFTFAPNRHLGYEGAALVKYQSGERWGVIPFTQEVHDGYEFDESDANAAVYERLVFTDDGICAIGTIKGSSLEYTGDYALYHINVREGKKELKRLFTPTLGPIRDAIYAHGAVHLISQFPDTPTRFNYLYYNIMTHQSRSVVYAVEFDPLCACLGVRDEEVFFAGLDVTETGVYVFIDTFNK